MEKIGNEVIAAIWPPGGASGLQFSLINNRNNRFMAIDQSLNANDSPINVVFLWRPYLL